MDSINWGDLKVFMAIAQEKSLMGAARCLGVTHSTVFRRINGFEADVGTKLFKRAADGFELTEQGKDMLFYVNNVSDNINSIDRMLTNKDDELCGNIQLTAPHNLAYRYLPSYVYDFNQSYPDINLDIMVSNADYNLSRCEADIAIRATASPPEHLIGWKLFSLPWGVYASQSYLDECEAPQTAQDLAQHKIVACTPELAKLPAFKWLYNQISQDNIIVRCNDLVSMARFTIGGLGLTVLPDDQACPELTRLFSLPNNICSDIWLLMHPELRECSRLQVFKNHLIEAFRSEETFQQYGQFD